MEESPSFFQGDNSHQEQLPPSKPEEQEIAIYSPAIPLPKPRMGEVYFQGERIGNDPFQYWPDTIVQAGYSYNHCYRRA